MALTGGGGPGGEMRRRWWFSGSGRCGKESGVQGGGRGVRLKDLPGDLGVRAADLETSEKRGEDGSARGKRTEPLLRVIPGSGEEASRREGLR